MKEKRLVWRIIVYITGLFVLSCGVVFAINSDLGVSPVNSLPYITSLILQTQIGMLTTIMLIAFMALQLMILRKDYKWINLTQIIFSFIFGFFLNFAIWLIGDLHIPTYFGRLGMLAISIVLIAAALVLIMGARLVILPPEGLCVAIASKIKNGKFHVVKMFFDSALVAASIALSFIFLGELQGVREGTVISALAIGKIIPYVKKLLNPILNKL